MSHLSELNEIPAGLDESNLKTVVVCGLSGAGKSHFINVATGAKLKVGCDLEPGTDQVIDRGIPFTRFEGSDAHIQLVDTPGFQTLFDKDDISIFTKITEWLAARYSAKRRVVGLIYLRSIQEPRVSRHEEQVIQMFKDLCGSNCLNRIVWVTNRWPLGPDQGEQTREQLLKTSEKAFGPTNAGTNEVQTKRLKEGYTIDDTDEILKMFLDYSPVTLQIQREVVDNQTTFKGTTAGGKIYNALKRPGSEERNENNSTQLESEAAQMLEEKPSYWTLVPLVLSALALALIYIYFRRRRPL
ncbi:unnamed protein product [Rhizoctonia solani]|uniref:G domain-containing protein n=1 Tax=Rhizoctonia solani TaxID=456999 RepID=A0A8H3A3I9_9AGAM|nr:unnamed protein product [Rhizoctonia solani]